MNLEEFVKKHKTQEEAALVLGLTQGMISGRLTGRYKMTVEAALDLEKRSSGVMTRNDLRPDIFTEAA